MSASLFYRGPIQTAFVRETWPFRWELAMLARFGQHSLGKRGRSDGSWPRCSRAALIHWAVHQHWHVQQLPGKMHRFGVGGRGLRFDLPDILWPLSPDFKLFHSQYAFRSHTCSLSLSVSLSFTNTWYFICYKLLFINENRTVWKKTPITNSSFLCSTMRHVTCDLSLFFTVYPPGVHRHPNNSQVTNHTIDFLRPL